MVSLRYSRFLGEASSFTLVLNPHMVTDRASVFHCTTFRELETAAIGLYQKYHALVACQFYEIEKEFRLVMLNGGCSLYYRKNRPSMVAKGKYKIL